MFLIQKEQILQVLYYFNIMKVIVVKCLPLQNIDLLRMGRGQKGRIMK